MEDEHTNILLQYSEQLDCFISSRNNEENALLEQNRQLREMLRLYMKKIQQKSEQCKQKDDMIMQLQQHIAALEKPTLIANIANGVINTRTLALGDNVGTKIMQYPNEFTT